MKNKKLFLIPMSLTLLITACSKSENADSMDSVSEHKQNSISLTQTRITETEAPETESITATTVSSQSDSSIAETTTTTITTTTTTTTTTKGTNIFDTLPKPVINESAISDAKSQLEDNDIIARRDTVKRSSRRKCVLYITSCGNCYIAYHEREKVDEEDKFWLGDIDDTPQKINEIEDAQYFGRLTNDEISELINLSLSIDPNADRYEDLRGEDEDAPAVERPVYSIYTFMIWNESHERTIYKAFVRDNLDYFLHSSDACADIAAEIISTGSISDKHYRCCGIYLDLY